MVYNYNSTTRARINNFIRLKASGISHCHLLKTQRTIFNHPMQTRPKCGENNRKLVDTANFCYTASPQVGSGWPWSNQAWIQGAGGGGRVGVHHPKKGGGAYWEKFPQKYPKLAWKGHFSTTKKRLRRAILSFFTSKSASYESKISSW